MLFHDWRMPTRLSALAAEATGVACGTENCGPIIAVYRPDQAGTHLSPGGTLRHRKRRRSTSIAPLHGELLPETAEPSKGAGNNRSLCHRPPYKTSNSSQEDCSFFFFSTPISSNPAKSGRLHLLSRIQRQPEPQPLPPPRIKPVQSFTTSVQPPRSIYLAPTSKES